ncbi:MAG: arginase [Bacteroidota bacterium]
MKKINFIINTSEITAGTRGSSLGPEAMMVAARNQGSKLFGQFPLIHIPNQNHLLDFATAHQFAKRIDGLLKIYTALNQEVSSVLLKNEFPLVLASDHGSAGGTIAGIKSAFPDKRLGVIWIDAHADIHSPYTTPSGNIHGMPLSSALNEDNLACKSNDVPSETINLWNDLKNIGSISPKILHEDLVFIAVRDTEEQEDEVIARNRIKNYSVDEVTLRGEKEIADEVLNKLDACDIIYISFDVDSMDPNFTSHGTGTPVDRGLTPIQAENLILNLLDSPKITCLEIVEVNPCLDENINKMAEIAFQILESITNKLTN